MTRQLELTHSFNFQHPANVKLLISKFLPALAIVFLTTQVSAQETTPKILKLSLDPTKLRQEIDGFGGSIAFWGSYADDVALTAGLKELNTSIVRTQGEVSQKGVVDHNRDVLQRAMKLKPSLEVLLTFWQPRSKAILEKEDWLEPVEGPQGKQYTLKVSMEDAWADEMVKRIKQYIGWGINVTTVGVQNESNYSPPNTQTCMWEPERLGRFISQKLKPRLTVAGLKSENCSTRHCLCGL